MIPRDVMERIIQEEKDNLEITLFRESVRAALVEWQHCNIPAEKQDKILNQLTR